MEIALRFELMVAVIVVEDVDVMLFGLWIRGFSRKSGLGVAGMRFDGE